MKTLSKQISNLLFVHDCVIVPGLGAFITNYKPATIHTQHHTFYPPSRQITFNAALNHNDGILINAYASALAVDFTTAKNLLDEKIHTMRISLMKGNKIELDDIGYLISNRENNLEFYPVNKINYLSEAYGFTKFDFNPVNRDTDFILPGIDKQVVRHSMRLAAVLLPLAAVALFTTLNTGTINRLYDNYASFLPARTQTISLNQKNSSNATHFVAPKPTIKTSPKELTPTEQLSPDQTSTSHSVQSKVSDAQPTIIESSENCTFHIIAGAFGVPENAQRFADELKTKGYAASVIGPNRRNLHLVSIQSFSNKIAADEKMNELKVHGFPSAWLLQDK